MMNKWDKFKENRSKIIDGYIYGKKINLIAQTFIILQVKDIIIR